MTLTQAFDYAKNNPNSKEAIQLTEMIATGQLDEPARQAGLDISQAKSQILQEKGIQEVQTEPQDQVFDSKAMNFLASPVEGLGKGIAAGLGQQKRSKEVEQIIAQETDIQNQLINKRNQMLAEGVDTSRIDAELERSQGRLAGIGGQAESLVTQDVSDRDVVGSALKTAGLFAGGLGVSRAATGVAGATGKTVLQGAIQGLKTGATEGAIGGAAGGLFTGAGQATEEGAEGADITKRAFSTAAGGALTGGILGGALGAVGGGITTRMKLARERRQQIADIIEKSPDSRTAKYMIDGAGQIQKDPVAIKTIDAGVDEGTVALVKGMNAKDKQKALKMMQIADEVRFDKKKAALMRPTDVVGETVAERFIPVVNKNKEIGKQIGKVAKGLKGQNVDLDGAYISFMDDLDDMGIATTTTDKGDVILDFAGSDIEGIKPAETLMNDLFSRIKTGADDGFKGHQLKKFIDERVTYGKVGEGLTGKSERVAKALRANIDDSLDVAFPEYKAVNDQYRVTINAIDQFKDAFGKKLDINDPQIKAKIGQTSRRVFSNTQKARDLVPALKQLQDTAEAFGSQFDDDVVSQIAFADVVEQVYPIQTTTSLAGQTQKGTQDTVKGALNFIERLKSGQLVGAVAGEVAEAVDSARGKTVDNAIDALKELIQQ